MDCHPGSWTHIFVSLVLTARTIRRHLRQDHAAVWGTKTDKKGAPDLIKESQTYESELAKKRNGFPFPSPTSPQSIVVQNSPLARQTYLNAVTRVYFNPIRRHPGLAILLQRFLDVYLGVSFYKMRSKRRITLPNLEDIDTDPYRDATWIWENDMANLVSEVLITTEDCLNRVATIKLAPGSAGIPITEENKKEYNNPRIRDSLWRPSSGYEKVLRQGLLPDTAPLQSRKVQLIIVTVGGDKYSSRRRRQEVTARHDHLHKRGYSNETNTRSQIAWTDETRDIQRTCQRLNPFMVMNVVTGKNKHLPQDCSLISTLFANDEDKQGPNSFQGTGPINWPKHELKTQRCLKDLSGPISLCHLVDGTGTHMHCHGETCIGIVPETGIAHVSRGIPIMILYHVSIRLDPRSNGNPDSWCHIAGPIGRNTANRTDTSVIPTKPVVANVISGEVYVLPKHKIQGTSMSRCQDYGATSSSHSQVEGINIKHL
ncbi:hypothetical protein BS47DRAFT_1396421 [Hydnum rufescens UP504]|uniref:HECT-type E3 ubiquitin transferase n=1 Tax=Hydnum rufescens UP504 TaxID=1448309 RepID=A0A9P6AQ96_9AGAM|nr:hypothetical protein BS47DRAFT_1396421 [Hydnum rufescens UP504]